ncbi:hypothetical protein CEXT_89571 [Caerostris extrusa]|uniref:Uncharacterized protein n=1 Tax=Caerostris extrusa TaxID=172846 RepID=A0AAV4MLR0_CAEEX|nr:hypothetical protein CEXT_89571 [Caerostris extrusa]
MSTQPRITPSRLCEQRTIQAIFESEHVNECPNILQDLLGCELDLSCHVALRFTILNVCSSELSNNMVNDCGYAGQIDDHSENTFLNNQKRLRKGRCKRNPNYSSKVSSKSTCSSESQNVCPHSKDSVEPQDVSLHSDDSSVPHVILCDSLDEKTLCCTYCSFKGDTLTIEDIENSLNNPTFQQVMKKLTMTPLKKPSVLYTLSANINIGL